MIPTNLSPVAKQLPVYLFYKLPNNKGYRMFTTKPTAISHTFDLNIGKKTLTDAINIKFDRDYKGTQLIKKLFNLQEIHCRSNPDVLTVNLEKKNVKNQNEANAIIRFIKSLSNKKNKPVVVKDLAYDPYTLPGFIDNGFMDIHTCKTVRRSKIHQAGDELKSSIDSRDLFGILDNINNYIDVLLRREPATKAKSNKTLKKALKKANNNDYNLRMLHDKLSNLVYIP